MKGGYGLKISDILKAKRQAYHLTQEQLAKKLYVSTRTISNWETGRTLPDVQSLIQLALFYNLSLDDLLLKNQDMLHKVKNQRKHYYVFISLFVITIVLFILILLEGSNNNMDNISVSLGSMIIFSFILYFVIRWAVKSAVTTSIIETKVRERALVVQFHIQELYYNSFFLSESNISGFHKLCKEQRKTYRQQLLDKDKEINECYMKLHTTQLSDLELEGLHQQMILLIQDKKNIHQEINEALAIID